MSVIDTHEEFAIEAPGRGYIDAYTGQISKDPSRMSAFDEIKNAQDSLDSTKRRYTSMGCPEIADTLRVVRCITTVSRSAWEPLP